MTNPTRTLIDLGAVVDAHILETALEDAIVRRLTTVAQLTRRAEALAIRGRPGSATLRKILEKRGHTPGRESALESELFFFLRRSRLQLPVPQFKVWDGTRFIARLDFAFPERKVGIEADGTRHHSAPRDREKDLLRLK